QIAAAGARDWDVAVTGAVATVLGTALADLRLVAVANDEAPAHVLVARSEDAALIAQPQTLRGKQVFVTLNSAAELVLLGCIRRWWRASSPSICAPSSGSAPTRPTPRC